LDQQLASNVHRASLNAEAKEGISDLFMVILGWLDCLKPDPGYRYNSNFQIAVPPIPRSLDSSFTPYVPSTKAIPLLNNIGAPLYR
jgi:hypothetical protein